MDAPNPEFPVPPDEARIWRYMSLPKLVSLLHTASLWFCRADLLDDPFEGSHTQANVAARAEEFRQMQVILGEPAASINADDMARSISALSEQYRRQVFVNCWHVADGESAAMWSQYSDRGTGIAIQGTFGNLRESLPDDPILIILGLVGYLDFVREGFAQWNAFVSFFRKRQSFEHEKELRALVFRRREEASGLFGVPVQVDLQKLIGSIVVSPLQEDWFTDAVRAVADKFGFGDRVRRSDMDADPVY